MPFDGASYLKVETRRSAVSRFVAAIKAQTTLNPQAPELALEGPHKAILAEILRDAVWLNTGGGCTPGSMQNVRNYIGAYAARHL